MAFQSFDMKVRAWDAKYNFPRPADEQHLSSYRAFLRISGLAASAAALVLSCLLTSLLVLFALYRLSLVGVPLVYAGLFGGLMIFISLACLATDLTNLTIPFTRFRQRETFGTARRATVQDLKGLGMLNRRHTRPDKPMIFVGTFGAFYDIGFNLEHLSGHTGVFGPPRSGKTVNVFLPAIRQWAAYGSCVCLDTKSNLHRFTAYYYEERYRLDLEHPHQSDRLPLLSELKHNPEAAGALCALMVGINPNRKTTENPFWKDMAVALGKALFLHLASIIEHPTPAHVLQFLGTHPREGGIDYLHIALSRSTDRNAREAWNSFHRYDLKLQSGVMATLQSTLDQFTAPAAQVVFSSPTERDFERGVKQIDLTALRRHSTIIYVTIGEGKAKALSHVLATIFGVIARSLEAQPDFAYDCPCLMAIDEAGNIFLDGITDKVNFGRELGIFYLLGYQSKTQPEEQYGGLAGASLLQGINNKIFMAGINVETAEWASKLAGTTTVMQHSMTDVAHDAFDSERLAETGRPLIEPTAFREMLQYKQACMFVTGAPYIPFALLENAKETDARQSVVPHYNFDEPPSYITLHGAAWLRLKREIENALQIVEGDVTHANHLIAARTKALLSELTGEMSSPVVETVKAPSGTGIGGNDNDEIEDADEEEDAAKPRAAHPIISSTGNKPELHEDGLSNIAPQTEVVVIPEVVKPSATVAPSSKSL